MRKVLLVVLFFISTTAWGQWEGVWRTEYGTTLTVWHSSYINNVILTTQNPPNDYSLYRGQVTVLSLQDPYNTIRVVYMGQKAPGVYEFQYCRSIDYWSRYDYPLRVWPGRGHRTRQTAYYHDGNSFWIAYVSPPPARDPDEPPRVILNLP